METWASTSISSGMGYAKVCWWRCSRNPTSNDAHNPDPAAYVTAIGHPLDPVAPLIGVGEKIYAN